MRRFVTIFTFLLALVQVANAQAQVPQARLEAALQFNEQHGKKWHIRWNGRSGTLSSLLGGKVPGL